MLEFFNNFSFSLGALIGFFAVGVLAAALAMDRLVLIPFLSASLAMLLALVASQGIPGALEVASLGAGIVLSAALFAGAIAFLGRKS